MRDAGVATSLCRLLRVLAPQFVRVQEEDCAIAHEGRVFRVRKVGWSLQVSEPFAH